MNGPRILLLSFAVAVLAPGPLVAQVPVEGAADSLPRVLVLATGGTIASRPGAAQLRGEDLVDAVPALGRYARITTEQFANLGSSAMTPRHWLELSQRIGEAFHHDPDLAGVVVTHGTDSMEETAYFLHLTVRDPRPVVVVGSMRSATALSADGPANLLGAVRVAVSPESRGKGTLVVLNDEINSARDARKTDNLRVQSFRAPELGLLGYADPDTVVFYRETLRRHTTTSEFDVTGIDELPHVAIVTDFPGFDGSTMAHWARQGVEGLVVVGFGGGRLSPGATTAVLEAARGGMLVVVTSRVPGGRVTRRTVAGPKGPTPLVDLGIAVGDDLPPHKARVLLMLALTRDMDARQVQRAFDQY